LFNSHQYTYQSQRFVIATKPRHTYFDSMGAFHSPYFYGKIMAERFYHAFRTRPQLDLSNDSCKVALYEPCCRNPRLGICAGRYPRRIRNARQAVNAREIVPSFSASTYFAFAIRVSRILSTAMYRVRIGSVDDDALRNVVSNFHRHICDEPPRQY